AGRGLPWLRVPRMRQYLVDTAAEHHITAGKHRHQPTGHAINCAPSPPQVRGGHGAAAMGVVSSAATSRRFLLTEDASRLPGTTIDHRPKPATTPAASEYPPYTRVLTGLPARKGSLAGAASRPAPAPIPRPLPPDD